MSSTVFIIPDNLIFSPCKVDGDFWSQFHVLISFLGQPEELVHLRDEDPEQYASIIQPLITFVQTTEQELHSKGFLKESEVGKNQNAD